MSERKCTACGGTFRVGTRALVFDPAEGLVASNVCPNCATHGELIVPVQPTRYGFSHAQGLLDANRKSQAEVLAPFIATLEGQCKGLRAATSFPARDPAPHRLDDSRAALAFHEGKLEAMENVLAMLKEGRA